MAYSGSRQMRSNELNELDYTLQFAAFAAMRDERTENRDEVRGQTGGRSRWSRTPPMTSAMPPISARDGN
jgi:hypothetical protein